MSRVPPADGYTSVAITPLGAIAFRPLMDTQREAVAEAGPLAEAVLRRYVEAAVIAAEFDHLGEGYEAAAATIYGHDLAGEQVLDADNLVAGVGVWAAVPWAAGVAPCERCRRHWMDPRTGECEEVDGQPVERPPEAALPCETDTGCPFGHWSRPVSLSPKNRKALLDWLERRASGGRDDGDWITRRNGRLIEVGIGRGGRPRSTNPGLAGGGEET